VLYGAGWLVFQAAPGDRPGALGFEMAAVRNSSAGNYFSMNRETTILNPEPLDVEPQSRIFPPPHHFFGDYFFL